MKYKDGDFKQSDPIIPQRKQLHTRFKAIVEEVDFNISLLGEIQFK